MGMAGPLTGLPSTTAIWYYTLCRDSTISVVDTQWESDPIRNVPWTKYCCAYDLARPRVRWGSQWGVALRTSKWSALFTRGNSNVHSGQACGNYTSNSRTKRGNSDVLSEKGLQAAVGVVVGTAPRCTSGALGNAVASVTSIARPHLQGT
eukprot:m.846404 g.846404  ORF g.846404 m.846404 type:complete len:150 (+) comp23477_c1_seq97:1200-1649(+)